MTPIRPKLVLVMVDSLRTEMLKRTVAAGRAPNFAALLERGELIEDCVSSFPSVTPVCTSEMTTGVRPNRHWISGMNWFSRAEMRYVEYGSSFEATRAFGLFRSLYDTVYNMNMAHLSSEERTLFEHLADAGLRTACTPFIIFRGRTRHEVGLDGLLRTLVNTARFHHAVWGPEEFYYGELYGNRPMPCKPTLARPGTRDEYSGCVGRELIQRDLYDFMLFSLPDNDHHTHNHGPESQEDSIAHADASFGELVDAGGGIDQFLESNAVILVADHSQSEVTAEFDVIGALAESWKLVDTATENPGEAELAVSPTARAASVYVLDSGEAFAARHAAVTAQVRSIEGADVVAHLRIDGGAPPQRFTGPGGEVDLSWLGNPSLEAVVWRGPHQLRFRPGDGHQDLRGAGWQTEGDLETLLLSDLAGGAVDSIEYPDALGRLWAALIAPQAGDILISCSHGYECVDWGGSSHLGGGSHGSLHRVDSVGPLLTVGLADPATADQGPWAIRDVANLVLRHFELDPVPDTEGPGLGSASQPDPARAAG